MNVSKLLAAAAGSLVLIATMGMLCRGPRDTRSAGPVTLADVPPSAPAKTFSRDSSTGLFVGVRTFPHDETLTVPYAVDDAVDLAYRFALDGRVRLVTPRRIVLALSGNPQKEDSKKHLEELKKAGAQVVGATSGDILRFLQQQAQRAGDDGLLVVSIASHGFQNQKGDSYILGSSSAFGSPETSLPLATLLDVAARVPRSLFFIDACRERLQASRGAAPDPAAAAPHLRRMNNVRGQVIFYAASAGNYAFDDPFRQNGVFTGAVLDGLACEASAPRDTVVVETLHRFVDGSVRSWILENKKKVVDPATQVSMEGETRSMPLSSCWSSPHHCVRASMDGSVVTAYGPDTQPVWRKDFGEPVVDAEAADLDADGFCDLVVGFRHRLSVLEIDGKPRWSRPVDGMSLQTFTTGDLFEKHTKEIVSVWNDGRMSRLIVTRGDGKERSHSDYAGLVEHVIVGRPTNMHAPKIIVATKKSLLVLHPKTLKVLWHRMLAPTDDVITELGIVNADDDSRLDIAVGTGPGTTWFTFDGRIVRQRGRAVWQHAAPRRRR